MKRSSFLLFACVACLASACGLTFGVDAVTHVREIETDATGVDELYTGELGVLNGVTVCGGAKQIEASLTALEWVDEDADPEVVPLGFALRREGSAVTLELGGGDEAVTLEDIELRAPSSVSPRIAVASGSVTVCDFDAPVEVYAPDRFVTLRDVRGSAYVDAASVRLEQAPSVDLVTTGKVTGAVATGGFISATRAIVTLTGPEAGELMVEVGGGTSAEEEVAYVYLPPGQGFNVRVQTRGWARVDVGDVGYDSADEGARQPYDGIRFRVNGGGPLIDVVADVGGIAIAEDPN